MAYLLEIPFLACTSDQPDPGSLPVLQLALIDKIHHPHLSPQSSSAVQRQEGVPVK